MIQMSLFTKQDQTQGVNLWLPMGKRGRGGGIDWQLGNDLYTLLYLK